MQVEFAQQEQNDPNVSPVYPGTAVSNATESTATANVSTSSRFIETSCIYE